MCDDPRSGDRDGKRDKEDKDVAEDTRPTADIRPADERVGEGSDNLKRREGWFKRRSGRDQL